MIKTATNFKNVDGNINSNMKKISADHSGSVRNFDVVTSREEAELFAKAIKSAYDSYYKLTGDVGNKKVKYHENADGLVKCRIDKSFNDFIRGGHEMDCWLGGAFLDHSYTIKPTDWTKGKQYAVHARWDPEDVFEIFADEKYD